MAIQPIDLQTMYSQLSNVSKTMSGHQQAQLTEAMQQQSNIQKNLENAEKVQQTSDENSKSSQINQDGAGSQGFKQNFSQNKKQNKDSETDDKPAPNGSPYIGTIIDITR